MHKKCAVIAVVLLLLSVICAAEQIIVLRLTQDALAKTQELQSLIEAGELGGAKEKTHALDRTWDQQAKLLEIIVDHRSTDEVRYALSRLEAALRGGDRAAALIYAGELEGGIEHVRERQTVTLENML